MRACVWGGGDVWVCVCVCVLTAAAAGGGVSARDLVAGW